jgi:hypothetical protein
VTDEVNRLSTGSARRFAEPEAGEESGMGWERSVLALLDDLEQQAEGLQLVERDLEVADRSRAEYARVDLASRLHAVAGREVRVTLLGGLSLVGTVGRTGDDWLLLTDRSDREWIVRRGALAVLRGASSRAVPDAALGVVRRLSLRSVLRRLAEEGADCLLHLVDGSRLDGRLLRLGDDFAEVRLEAGPATESYDLVPLTALAAVQRRT